MMHIYIYIHGNHTINAVFSEYIVKGEPFVSHSKLGRLSSYLRLSPQCFQPCRLYSKAWACYVVWASYLVWWKCPSATCVTRWGVCPLPNTDRTKWILNCRPRIATLPPWMITGRNNGARQRNSLTPLVAQLTCSRSCLVCYLFSNTSSKSCFLFYIL